jgi:hypothetical protein
VFKVPIFIMTLVCSAASWAVQPPCLPAVMAMAAEPFGEPVAANTYWPTISNAPIDDGLAVFWHCHVNGEVRVLEVHGTPQAIANSGGLQKLQSLYLSDKDAALASLDAIGHACVDTHPQPPLTASRADCVAFPPRQGQAMRYLCLNPSVTNRQETRLCTHLLHEMVAQWPQ